MANEFDNTKGFSRLPQNPEFIDDMKKYLRKTLKYAMISVPIIYIVVLIITAIVSAKKDGLDMRTFIPVAIVLLAIFVIIGICVCISSLRNIGKLKLDSVDGTVIKKKKWSTYEREGRTRKTKYLITIETEDGKKVKVKDAKAAAVFEHVEEGEKVRFHPGYPFPVELFDKSRNGVNVCAFCGAANDLNAKTCTRCKNLMLI
ncbi:MAG: hypothetical protein J5590_03510 [Clostridia bacterium]|nr:hypothetical protein [Clostridia bacterium]